MIDTTTTSTTPLPLDYVAEEQRPLSVRAIDNHNKMPQFFNIADQKEIKEKFAPFIPQLRPWLVIVEVNMTNKMLNTECTGRDMISCESHFEVAFLGSVLSPLWVITSRSCICGDK